MGSLARANNCLWFALTRDTLHVGAHFPFNMFMPRFIAGLDLTIPAGAAPHDEGIYARERRAG